MASQRMLNFVYESFFAGDEGRRFVVGEFAPGAREVFLCLDWLQKLLYWNALPSFLTKVGWRHLQYCLPFCMCKHKQNFRLQVQQGGVGGSS